MASPLVSAPPSGHARRPDGVAPFGADEPLGANQSVMVRHLPFVRDDWSRGTHTNPVYTDDGP